MLRRGATLKKGAGAAKEPIFEALQLLVQYVVVGIGEWSITHIPKIIRVSVVFFVSFLLFLFSLFQMQYKICMLLYLIFIYMYTILYVCTL